MGMTELSEEAKQAVRAAYRLGHADARCGLHSEVLCGAKMEDPIAERKATKEVVLRALGFSPNPL